MPDQENLPIARLSAEPPATQEPSVALMLQQVIQGGVSNENVAALEKLVGLYERMQDRNAEKEFARAFNALQTDTPKIQARKPVPNNDGTVRYCFAPYEELMAQVAPLLQKHGFTVTFSNRLEEGRLTAICTLQHIGGHKRTNEFTVRVGKGPPGSSEAQGDGAASTYAKRFALTNALNIVIEKDSDARLEGGAITPEQADDLRRRVRETASNEAAFLKFAGAKTFEEISETKLAMLDANLRRKEKTA